MQRFPEVGTVDVTLKKARKENRKTSRASARSRQVLEWRKKKQAEGRSFYFIHLSEVQDRELRAASAQRGVRSMQKAFEAAVAFWVAYGGLDAPKRRRKGQATARVR